MHVDTYWFPHQGIPTHTHTHIEYLGYNVHYILNWEQFHNNIYGSQLHNIHHPTPYNYLLRQLCVFIIYRVSRTASNCIKSIRSSIWYLWGINKRIMGKWLHNQMHFYVDDDFINNNNKTLMQMIRRWFISIESVLVLMK